MPRHPRYTAGALGPSPSRLAGLPLALGLKPHTASICRALKEISPPNLLSSSFLLQNILSYRTDRTRMAESRSPHLSAAGPIDCGLRGIPPSVTGLAFRCAPPQRREPPAAVWLATSPWKDLLLMFLPSLSVHSRIEPRFNPIPKCLRGCGQVPPHGRGRCHILAQFATHVDSRQFT